MPRGKMTLTSDTRCEMWLAYCRSRTAGGGGEQIGENKMR
jgi:hypothetical protein